VDLVNKVGESLLRRKVVGEKPSVVKTASLSMVLGRQRPRDLSRTKIEEGGTSFVLPPGDVLGTGLENFKFIDSQVSALVPRATLKKARFIIVVNIVGKPGNNH
jgi:hypothetical protein